MPHYFEKTWTDEELAWLDANASSVTCLRASAHLGKSPHAVEQMARKRNLSFDKTAPRTRSNGATWKRWTEEDMKYLRENHKTKTLKELSDHLGRKRDSIRQMLVRIGGKAKTKDKPWRTADDHKLRELAEKYDFYGIAKSMNRTYASVKTRARVIGITHLRGTYSLSNAAESTGYDVRQLLRAKKNLNQHWNKVRYSWTHRYVITEEQLEALCEWLKTERRSASH